LPGIKEYLRYRLKSMKENDMNTPENFMEISKQFEKIICQKSLISKIVEDLNFMLFMTVMSL
jgi:hypothetical protein